MQRFALLIGYLLFMVSPVWAADIKLAAYMNKLYFDSANICSNITYTPDPVLSLPTITAKECVDKTAVGQNTLCTLFLTQMVNRAAAQYALALDPINIGVIGCPTQ